MRINPDIVHGSFHTPVFSGISQQGSLQAAVKEKTAIKERLRVIVRHTLSGSRSRIDFEPITSDPHPDRKHACLFVVENAPEFFCRFPAQETASTAHSTQPVIIRITLLIFMVIYFPHSLLLHHPECFHLTEPHERPPLSALPFSPASWQSTPRRLVRKAPCGPPRTLQ